MRLAGLTTEESLGEGWLNRIDPADRGPLLSGIRNAAAQHPSATMAVDWAVAAAQCELTVGVDGRRSRCRLLRHADSEVLIALTPDLTPDLHFDGHAATAGGLVDVVAHELFDLTLDLAVCANFSIEPARSRIAAAIDRIDLLITSLRDSVVEQLRANRQHVPGP